MVFCKEDNKDKCNKAFKALVLNAIANNDFKEQDSDCFLIIFRTLFVNKAAFVSIELANKAYAYLLIAPTDATDPIIKANLFVYSTTTTSQYTSTVFIKIMVDTSVSKKFTAGYCQGNARPICPARLICPALGRLASGNMYIIFPSFTLPFPFYS
jgi:hypothetical protein